MGVDQERTVRRYRLPQAGPEPVERQPQHEQRVLPLSAEDPQRDHCGGRALSDERLPLARQRRSGEVREVRLPEWGAASARPNSEHTREVGESVR